MKTIAIEDALKQIPFRPFDLLADNGRIFRVKHPEFLLFNEAKTVCVVTEGEHVHLLDLDHLSSLTFQQSKKRHA